MEKHLGMVIFFSLIIGELFLVRLVEGLVLLLLAADSFCVVGAAGLLFALWTVYFCAMPQNAMDLRALRLNPRYMPVVMYFLFLIFSQGNGWLELTISLVCGYATVLVCPLGLWNYIMLPEYLEPLSALNFRTSSAV